MKAEYDKIRYIEVWLGQLISPGSRPIYIEMSL